MKKFLALLLTLAMFSSLLSIPAMAEETHSFDFPGVGVTLEIPTAYGNTVGIANSTSGNELGYNTGWYYMEVKYIAMTRDEYDDFMSMDEYTEDDIAVYQASTGYLFMILSVAPTTNIEELIAYLETLGMTLDRNSLTEIGQADGYTFYQYIGEQDTSLFRPEFAEEFNALQAMVPEITATAKFYAPVNPFAEMIGKPLSFTTTDIDGNPITSEELFGRHEITMLNLWTSTCHFCIEELPDLEEINGRLAEKDCAIVGLLYDGFDPDAVAAAKEILEDAGVTYTVILPPENADDLFVIEGFPTSLFVNREGVVVGEPVVGKLVDVYEPAIDSLLSAGAADMEKPAGVTARGAGAKSLADKGVSSNDAGMYRIIVLDEKGNPVEKAAIQFCSETECMLGKTDAEGMATFEVPEGSYTVHVLKVPAGYEKDSTEYTVPASYSDLSIVLKLS